MVSLVNAANFIDRMFKPPVVDVSTIIGRGSGLEPMTTLAARSTAL